MVLCWSPEPPQDWNDKVSSSQAENITVFETDDSDTENNGSNGYQLLPLDENAADSDNEISETEREDSVNNSAPNSQPITNNTPDSLPQVPSLPPCDITAEYNLPPRADIVVDSDQVQAAMAGFTLPPSAIPSWASSIPESQWTQHLMSRISSLQNRRND